MSDSTAPPPSSVCSACGAAPLPGSVLCASCGAPLGSFEEGTGPLDPNRQVPLAFSAGQPLGERYTVVERAGSGGMGTIYKAIDRKLGRTVAIKLIQAGASERPAAHERFKRELALAQQVSHPNVCRVHDLGEIEGQPFISMEFVEGQTLETLVQAMGHLSPSQTVAIAKQICAGLGAIHERGIVHRDLKPSNVMVDRLGHVVLMDFGMAYHEDQARLTQAGAVFGTLAYLAPEQARGRAEARSDLYALGLVLYEMLAGRRPPGDGGPLPLALRGKDEACAPPSQFSPEVPEALDRLVMRCLEREPGKRHASARELGEVLQQFEGELTSSGLLSRGLLGLAPRPRRWPWIAAGATLLVVLGALAGRAWMSQTVGPLKPTSVAFLPLAYAGPEEGAYLRNLLPLVLSQELQATPGLTVTPFAVSRTFGAEEDPRSVARQLGVAMVVKGTLEPQAADGSTVITLKAVTSDGKQTWDERLSGPVATVLDATPRLARGLSDSLGLDLSLLEKPRSPEALKLYLDGLSRLEGWDLAESGEKAAEAFQGALRLEPGFAEAHAGLARALLRQFKDRHDGLLVDLASVAADQSLKLAPTLPEAHLAKGLVYVLRGRTPEATKEFLAARQLAPADDNVSRQIGRAFAQLGRNDDATSEFEQAVRLRPGYWQNHNELGTHLLRIGQFERAEGLFRHVIELRPDSDTGYSNLAALLLLRERFAEAEPVLLGALKVHDSLEVRNNLGFLYYATSRFELAAQQWERAANTPPPRAEVFLNLGDAYRQLLRQPSAHTAYDRAIRLAREELAVNAEAFGTRGTLALALAGSGRCPEALIEIKTALAGSTQRADLLTDATVTFALCGRRNDAVKHAISATSAGLFSDLRTNPDLRDLLKDGRVRAALER